MARESVYFRFSEIIVVPGPFVFIIMKWFKHQSDAYTDFKMQDLMDDFGASAYGLYWILLELVAQQGRSYKVNSKQNWEKAAKRISKIPEKELKEILAKMGDLSLVDKSSLNKGILYIPKMKKYSDDYTAKVRRLFGQCPDNVPLDKIRLDKNRIDNIISSPQGRKDIKIIYLYAFKKEITEFTKEAEQSFIKRNLRAAMLLKGYAFERIIEVMNWLNQNADFKWKLETVSKYIDENLKAIKSKLNKEEDIEIPQYAKQWQKQGGSKN